MPGCLLPLAPSSVLLASPSFFPLSPLLSLPSSLSTWAARRMRSSECEARKERRSDGGQPLCVSWCRGFGSEEWGQSVDYANSRAKPNTLHASPLWMGHPNPPSSSPPPSLSDEAPIGHGGERSSCPSRRGGRIRTTHGPPSLSRHHTIRSNAHTAGGSDRSIGPHQRRNGKQQNKFCWGSGAAAARNSPRSSSSGGDDGRWARAGCLQAQLHCSKLSLHSRAKEKPKGRAMCERRHPSARDARSTYNRAQRTTHWAG